MKVLYFLYFSGTKEKNQKPRQGSWKSFLVKSKARLILYMPEISDTVLKLLIV